MRVVETSSEGFKCGDGGEAFCFCDTDGGWEMRFGVPDDDNAVGWVFEFCPLAFDVWILEVGEHYLFFEVGEVWEIDFHGLNYCQLSRGKTMTCYCNCHGRVIPL